MTPEPIARALMTHVYTRLTCVVALDAQGRIADGYLLDTLYARHAVRACEHAAVYWVFLGHPEGWTQMDELDEDVLDRLRDCVSPAPIRAFIAGEEVGCLEVDSGRA